MLKVFNGLIYNFIGDKVYICIKQFIMKRYTTLIFLLFFSTSLLSQSITLSTFATGLNSPTEIAHCGDDRMFVVEQGGTIKIVNSDGTVNSTPFLNLSSIISTGSERGLLGLAFHPDYANNGFFFVNYTNTSGNTVVARYSVSDSNPNQANASSGSIVITINQPYSNHNGGSIKFGPDGYLWIAMGDGGSGGDPQNYSQNKNSLLGKMLRLDVDGAAPYTVPADNPFVGTSEGSPEIWAYGLRNPWKFSFDSLTDELWIADVGQNALEEINRVSPLQAGLNYGWRCYEASATYNTSGCANSSTMTFPVAEYNRSSGRCSITGGYVYRGSEWSDIYGLYFFADYCSNQIGVVNQSNQLTFLSSYSGNSFTTFGEDNQQNLYVAGRQSGVMYKINGSVASVSSFDKSFKIYPNPATSTVFINNQNADVTIQQISIYDLSGKLVLDRKTAFDNEVSLDVSTITSGLYMIKITDSNQNTSVHKLKID